MTEGGGVFINREIELEKGEGLIIHGKRAEERCAAEAVFCYTAENSHHLEA